MSKKKTHEEYVAEVLIVNPNIEVVGKYIGNRVKILHRCKIDGYEWMTVPYNILLGKGCPKCAGNLKRTHEQYVQEVVIKNQNIEVLEKYINLQTPILHRCKIDGYQWMARPNNILYGKGCPKCARNIHKTHEEYIKELYQINPNIEVLEKYAGARTKILHKCKIDQHVWSVAPTSTLRGYGCPECQRRLLSQIRIKSHEEYVKQVVNVNVNIEVMERYCGSDTPILHKCKLDGHLWMARPSNILHGTGCPQCNQSHGEKQIINFLTKNNVVFISQKKFNGCKDKSALPFDFYLPQLNMCIEYDGLQHFEPVDFAGRGEEWASQQFLITKKHDQIKNQYCKDNNIRLLRIPYFKNVDEELNNFLFI